MSWFSALNCKKKVFQTKFNILRRERLFKNEMHTHNFVYFYVLFCRLGEIAARSSTRSGVELNHLSI